MACCAAGALVVLTRLSRVVDGVNKDLEITFSNPLAMQGEEESFALAPVPAVLPKCTNARFLNWTHPTLIIEGSWAEAYAGRKYVEDDPALRNVTHYFLVSMNDLAHVLCESKPVARWVASTDA